MSATTNLPFTQAPAEPQLKDVLDQLKKNIFLSLNCHHVGTIQSFDADTQTAQVTINYQQTYYVLNSKTGVYTQNLESYPILMDCPVIFLGGGQTSLTFPVVQGDECLVLFNDRDIDNWFTSSTTSNPPETARLHSMADAIILVGIRSASNQLDDFDTTRAAINNGTTKIGVGASKVLIKNASYQLGTLLNTLATQAQSVATQCAAITVGGTPPANAAAFTALATQLGTTATQISGLLE